ncbi:MAG: RNA 2',3'-cyclic phosphodiesterase [Candidatus Zixiibacteriota bacterium]
MAENDKRQRLFIALEIPKEIRNFIWEDVSSILRKSNIKVSWVKPDNMHITLKFLGDTPNSKIQEIISVLNEIFDSAPKIETKLGKAGTFGGRNPRVVWITPDGGIEMMKGLAGQINNRLASLGFKKDKRRFSTHLTLGRVRQRRNTEPLKIEIEKLDYPPLRFSISSAVLIRSTLTQHGAIYEPIKIWEFN